MGTSRSLIHIFLGLVILYPALACSVGLDQKTPIKSPDPVNHSCHGDSQPVDKSHQEMVCCDRGILPDLIATPKVKIKFNAFGLFAANLHGLDIGSEQKISRDIPVYTGPPINLLKILYQPVISPNAPPSFRI